MYILVAQWIKSGDTRRMHVWARNDSKEITQTHAAMPSNVFYLIIKKLSTTEILLLKQWKSLSKDITAAILNTTACIIVDIVWSAMTSAFPTMLIIDMYIVSNVTNLWNGHF